MVAEIVLCTWTLEVSRLLSRLNPNPILYAFLSVMSGYLPYHGQPQYPWGYVNQQASGHRPLLSNPPSSRTGGLPPQLLAAAQVQIQMQQLQQRQQQEQYNKALNVAAIGQFVQNFAFTNSDRYHPVVEEDTYRGAKSESDPQTFQPGTNINGDHWHSPTGNHRTSPGSSQATHTVTCSTDPDAMASPSSARGVKRQLETVERRYSPQSKRHRSEERELASRNQSEQHKSPNIRSPVKLHEYEAVTAAILKYQYEKKQPHEVYLRKMKLRDALYSVMKGVFPYCGLYVVGSSMNGFGNLTSDMDMCLMLSQSEIDQKTEATEILRIIHFALKKCTFLREVQLIKAKVPILKFRDKISNAECDLNINNHVGIRNTHLLSAYCKMDSRLPALVLFVKYWARAHKINNAKEGSLSSYSLGLMVIHYLQYGVDPPLLPSLQDKFPHKFRADGDVRTLSLNEKLPAFVSPNQETVGELFVGFLNYYAHTFDFHNDAISVRLAKTLPVQEAMRASTRINPVGNPVNSWKCVCIEEPYDLSNTARSVYDITVFMRILRVFRKSHAKLRQTGDVRSIIDNPL